jgi:hypothetical protein
MMMRYRARLYPDQTRLERAEEVQKLRSSHLSTDHGHPLVVDPMNLKDMLRDV